MADASSLATIAGIISAFGVAMLLFRIQRELYMQKAGEPSWMPWADRLLIGATLISVLFVILPMLLIGYAQSPWVLLPRAAAAAACPMVAGYVFGILAHYRWLFGKNRRGPRTNPEPAEKYVVLGAVFAALAVILWIVAQQWPEITTFDG
jgi:hypothetical protein